MKLKQKLKNFAVKLYVNLGGSSLRQGENLAPEGESAATPGMAELLRRAASEGAVLLKNDGTLPLKGKTALFGRVQTDTFYTGYGSGGDVVKPYRVSILDGMERAGVGLCGRLVRAYRGWAAEHPVDHGYWGNWPRCYPEMPLEESLVRAASQEADVAVVLIGRAAGEERENELEKGSYYLTDEEENMLSLVTRHFARVAVVVNAGSVIDLTWAEKYRVNALLFVWQGGMETGNAVADVLSGKVSPCGKLTDTIARSYADYPSANNFGGTAYNYYEEDIYVGYRYFETFAKEKVLYPFGFGLSYTRFSVEAEWTGEGLENAAVRFRVKNIGECAGREVVQVYAEKPCGTLGNPSRELAGFAKTDLLPAGGEQILEIKIPREAFRSYDSAVSAYVTEGGEYALYAGTDVRSAKKICTLVQTHTAVVEQCSEQCAPERSFSVLTAKQTEEGRVPVRTVVPAAKSDRRARMLALIPPDIPFTGDRGYRLSDVREGRATMEEFVAQLTTEELEALSRGDYVMNSPLGASGNAGVFGGVLASLREKGVPPVTATDGPSGIRLKRASSLVPNGTLLACTFDENLVAEVYAGIGREMKERGSDVLLAPGMNLHRDPLCGRNFEYFSEDPYLTGKIAAAAVRGVQSAGVSACPKHFACNNQEYNRNRNDSRLSERALRELYLRGFEICVKEGKPHNIMTSYNKINGVWGHYNFDLCRGILRGEWGFGGNVMTDWWMRSSKCPEFQKLKNNAYRVRAGVNLLMPGGGYLGRRKPDGTLLKTLGKREGITLGELQRNAAEILNFVMCSSAEERNEEREKQS